MTRKMFEGTEGAFLAVGTNKSERLPGDNIRIGIEAAKPGNTTGDIGAAIQTYVEAQRCSVVRDFCGHGLGLLFHDTPNILHYGRPGEGVELKPGMIFTIEPMINTGKRHVKLLPDRWTVVTKDRSLSAQWEHTILVTDDGYDVLTQLEGDEV